jgi:hypothetical protein
MSHIVTIQTQVRDPAAVAAACRRLSLPEPVEGTAELFSGKVTGLVVRFPNWQYPAVIDTACGTIHFDNYEGSWGDPIHLDRFLQAYAVEKCRLEGRKKGYTVNEQQLEDGSIRLQLDAA